MDLDWKAYGKGYLANPSHGYYLVYQRFFDLDGGSHVWLAKFEASGINHPPATLDLQRFATAEEAQAACEKHAEGFL